MAPISDTTLRFKGVPGSPGIVFGKAHLIDRKIIKIPQENLTGDRVDGEVERFRRALGDSKTQLMEIKQRIDRVEGKDHIFIIDTHLMIMEDEVVIEDVVGTIKGERINAEWALKKVFNRLKKVFDNIDDEYLRERAGDLDHISRRILQNLMGVRHDSQPLDVDEDSILVVHDLSPYDMAHVDRERIQGIATDVGGNTSHLSILARAMEIPAVVGLEEITAEVRAGDTIILDGLTGTVIVNPDGALGEEYRRRKDKYEKVESELRLLTDVPAVTPDGHEIELSANVELPEEVPVLMRTGTKSIGLFRSEYLYLVSHTLPDEDQCYKMYKEILEKVQPAPVTIRTLDVGGDKFLSQFNIPREANPALGLRAIRFCFKQEDVFRSQLRALAAASVHGNMRVMFPMISGLDELTEAKKMFAEAMDEIEMEGSPVNRDIQVGIMIEVPSAAMIADELAQEVDFFSIGTNDLIQYSLAIDRINEHVSYLYRPLHPAILRMVKKIVDDGHDHGIQVAMCGEMAGQPLYTPLLVGLGLDDLSMNSASLLKVKKIVRETPLADARDMAAEALSMRRPLDVERFVIGEMKRRFPELFEDVAVP